MLTPVNDNILVRPKKVEKTQNGIILPDFNDSRPAEGEVVSVGPGRHLEDGSIVPPPVKPGDKIYFKKFSPNEVEVEGEKLLVVTSFDVIGISS